MTDILAAVCIAILVVMALSLARAFNAPTVYDRILGQYVWYENRLIYCSSWIFDGETRLSGYSNSLRAYKLYRDGRSTSILRIYGTN